MHALSNARALRGELIIRPDEAAYINNYNTSPVRHREGSSEEARHSVRAVWV